MAAAVRRTLRVRRRPTGFRRILVPLGDADGAVRATAVACRLASDRGASLIAVAVVEVPAELPLDAQMTDEEELAMELLRLARAEADRYGVTNDMRLVRGRQAGESIVEEARSAEADLIVLVAERRSRTGRHGPVFPADVVAVLKHAPCRVLVTALATG
jgi:nucleotide-binding universal stress UspA family protein